MQWGFYFFIQFPCSLHFLVYLFFPSKVTQTTDIAQDIQRENHQETREN